MHIFISLHFFTIVGQIAELSYFAFRTMEWTEDHDVLLLREILASDLFSFKKGSVARGERWESIAETLNEVKTLSFHLKDKRAVRDRWVLLQKKYKAKMHQEETASGISVDDMSEIDVLLEELVGKEESLNKVYDAQSRMLKEDKSKAEDIRQKALDSLERYSETKKRKSTENGDDCDEKPRRQRRSARTEPLVEFMQEKTKTEQKLRQQELDLRRLEQQQNQQVMVTVLQQQQQTNQAILSVIQKLIEKKE